MTQDTDTFTKQKNNSDIIQQESLAIARSQRAMHLISICRQTKLHRDCKIVFTVIGNGQLKMSTKSKSQLRLEIET